MFWFVHGDGYVCVHDRA